MHKSLFDETELTELLMLSGFQSRVMFCYGYPGDVNELPVTMGFYATKKYCSLEQLQEETTQFLKQLDGKRLRIDTLIFIDNGV